MSLSHEIIQRIKDASEITAVIGERMNLTKKGVNYVGVCPFHADKSPSLTVSSAKQMYKCFACGAGGDAIKYIQESDGLTFYEACKFLARRANIELPADTEQTPEERAAAAKRESMLLHTKQEQNGYSQNQTKQFLAYLAERQLTLDIATAFGLGHSTNGFFADRITYPFYDISGNCVGHTGRALVWNKECQYPKYKNSPESPIFHKERLLFGLHQAKKEIAQRGKALLVEGQNDVLQLHQKGLGNAVCGSGTAFSEAQARLLQRFTSEVTMIYDGDAAGAKAAIKALQVFLPVGLSVNIITLPDGHDPDSFAKQFEPDKLKIVLKNMEKPWFNYMLTVYPYDANPEIAEPHLKELCELIALVPSDVKRKMYISAVASEFHIGADVVKRQIKPAPKTDTWKDGFYGFEEAKAILDEYDKIGILTFLESEFIDLVDEQPIIFYKGRAKKFAIQLLRKRFSEFVVNCESGNFKFEKQESTDLEVLREMHIEGIKITIEGYSENQQQWAFTDWYLEQYSKLFPTINSTEKSEFVRRCIEVIAYTEATMRTMNGASYASTLGIKIGAYNDLLKPILASKRDKNEMEKQRVDMEANIMDFDPGALPSYVMEDEIMAKVYQQSGFYPLLKKDSTPCAYMFKNDKGEGHSCVSDFYMVPLLHIYSNDDAANKRVIQLNHIHYDKKYVEWQSSVLANLGKVQEKLINAGAY
ncbi:MAG: CHC2 zinc finger domain-containing protein, partial [Paludibacter sp.]|nr:CHC2 zinc finger domain-containing protein [Paludibacter sp.]